MNPASSTKPLLLAVSALGVVLAFAACGSFGSADREGTDGGAAESGANESGGPDGAASIPDGAEHDASADAAPDAVVPPRSCNTSADCEANEGCCLTKAGSTCTTASACEDAFFIACNTAKDCAATEVCCFDRVSTSAVCTAPAACTGTKLVACAMTSECATATTTTACGAVACRVGQGMAFQPLALCATATGDTVSRAGVTCTLP